MYIYDHIYIHMNIHMLTFARVGEYSISSDRVGNAYIHVRVQFCLTRKQMMNMT